MGQTLSLHEIAVGHKVRLQRTQPPLDALAHRLPEEEVLGLVDLFTIGLSPPNVGPLSTRLTLPLWTGEDVVGFRCLTWSDNDRRPKCIPFPVPTPEHGPFGLCPSTVEALERDRFCVVVEGEVDALTLWAMGIPAVSCSTSYMATHQAAAVADLVDAVVVWTDFDEAGVKGREQTMSTLASLGVACVGMEDARPWDANALYTESGETAVKRAVTAACEAAAMFPGGTPWS